MRNVYTFYPEYVKYFSNPEEAKDVARWTEKYVDTVCPQCGYCGKKRVCDLITYGFNCRKCGDKSSYPNKFVYEFLIQLQKMYEFKLYSEHVFEWSNNLVDDNKKRRIYDFYIEYKNSKIIIEVQGTQHYTGSFYKYGVSLDDEVENDNYKQNLALNNGILNKNYIKIDARRSNSFFIKQSILTCGLNKILDFNENDIDWSLCEQFACKSLVKTVSELWNSGIKNTTKIAEIIGKSRGITIGYLKSASNLNWCNYNSELANNQRRKPILCIENNIAFESAYVCARVGLEVFGNCINVDSVRNAACGNTDTYRGKHFKYMSYNEFANHKKNFPQLTFMDESINDFQ